MMIDAILIGALALRSVFFTPPLAAAGIYITVNMPGVASTARRL
jgi:hypothetical protein